MKYFKDGCLILLIIANLIVSYYLLFYKESNLDAYVEKEESHSKTNVIYYNNSSNRTIDVIAYQVTSGPDAYDSNERDNAIREHQIQMAAAATLDIAVTYALWKIMKDRENSKAE